jgi:hypothetical protein
MNGIGSKIKQAVRGMIDPVSDQPALSEGYSSSGHQI